MLFLLKTGDSFLYFFHFFPPCRIFGNIHELPGFIGDCRFRLFEFIGCAAERTCQFRDAFRTENDEDRQGDEKDFRISLAALLLYQSLSAFNG